MTTATDVQRPPAESPAGAYRWDLDLLRILAILAVVSIHVHGLILGRPRLEGTPTWYFALAVDIGVKWCVPVFVMISGALLLAPRAHARGVKEFYRRRLVRLLPALVFWHVFYVIVVRVWLLGRPVAFDELMVQLIDARIYTALYFLWLILGLYAVAPVLAAFLGQGGPRRALWSAFALMAWTAAVVAAQPVASLLGDPRAASVSALDMWVGYVGLFVAGYALREPRATGLRWAWTGAVAVALMALATWQYDNAAEHPWLLALLPVGYTTPVIGLASLCVFVCVIDLCARVRPGPRLRAVLRTLGEATFGVFLVHLAVVAVIQVVLPEFYADPAPVQKLTMYAVVLVASYAISLAARRVPLVRRVF
jgi:surface polysaccharide O-acyltransferase-like enzyme